MCNLRGARRGWGAAPADPPAAGAGRGAAGALRGRAALPGGAAGRAPRAAPRRGRGSRRGAASYLQRQNKGRLFNSALRGRDKLFLEGCLPSAWLVDLKGEGRGEKKNRRKKKKKEKPGTATPPAQRGAGRGAARRGVVLFLCNLKKPDSPPHPFPPPVKCPAISRKFALLKYFNLCALFYSFKYCFYSSLFFFFCVCDFMSTYSS